MEIVTLPGSSPLVSFRILFYTGAASDPAGKEGVAALTAAMLAGGGSRSMSYEEILEAMYPMATRFEAQTDKEMTVFAGQTHVDNLAAYARIISEMLIEPGWREGDFKRLREDAINFLRENLRRDNDEELGKEALYNFIYEGHPYGHESTGTVESLERLTLDDVRAFYGRQYTRANLVIGLAGGYPPAFAEQFGEAFAAALPAGEAGRITLPEPPPIHGMRMRIIEKESMGTAISLGFPICVARGHRDWPALLVAQSYFGQHRSSNSYLYQRLRQIRGLNYGDYAYIEYFPRGMYQFHPDPNLARRQQIFQVWIRPVEPQNGLFALRAALFELRRLIEQGISEADFEATRRFLVKHASLLVQTQDARLGYALDSRFYGIPDYPAYLRQELGRLTRDEVNRAIGAHLRADDLKIVVVTKEAEAFRQAALANQPSPIVYQTPMPPDVLAEDRLIENYDLNLAPDAVEVIPVEEVFQK